MKILRNVYLSEYTTFRMGGLVKFMYYPESIEDLKKLSDKEDFRYIIGGGSNLLVNDRKVFDAVTNLKYVNTKIQKIGSGEYDIGASVRLKELIQIVNAEGFGGIEYLYSVPGLVGGAIYMNAGRGEKYRQSISDYIISVDYYLNGEIITIGKDDCQFSYRHSIFHEMDNAIIIGGRFKFDKIDTEVARKKIQERIDLCKSVQDMTFPNFGTVFSKADKFVMGFIKIINMGYRNGVCFSKKKSNWMLKKKEGNFDQAINLIERTIRIHKIFRKKCTVEVKIWK